MINSSFSFEASLFAIIENNFSIETFSVFEVEQCEPREAFVMISRKKKGFPQFFFAQFLAVYPSQNHYQPHMIMILIIIYHTIDDIF